MSASLNQGLGEQFHRELFRHAALAILVNRVTADGRPARFIEANNQAVSLTGYSREELLEKTAGDIFVQNDLHALLPASPSAALGGPPIAFTGTLLRRDQRQLLVEGTCCFSEIGGESVMITSFRDASAKRQAREEPDAAEETPKALHPRLGDLFSRVSHELRTPLSGVIGMADLLLRAELGPTERQYAAMLLRSSELLQKSLDELVLFSAHKSPPQSRPFDLAAEMRRRAEALSSEVVRRGCAFEFTIRALPGRLVGEANILGQLLERLVEAALASSEAPRIRLRVEADDPTANPCWVRITVESAAIGALGEGGAGDDRYRGGGLAIAVAQALAEDLRGTSGIERPDGGAPTFWARLPFGRDPEELWRGDPGARRVLVVEDDEVNQQVLRVMLRRLGLEVTLAPNGHKAVELARGGGFGLILMDLHLPGMNGLDAARAIRREEPSGRRSVIIATTACVFEEDRRECLLAGMDDFLSKPFTGRELQEVICQWIALDRYF